MSHQPTISKFFRPSQKQSSSPSQSQASSCSNKKSVPEVEILDSDFEDDTEKKLNHEQANEGVPDEDDSQNQFEEPTPISDIFEGNNLEQEDLTNDDGKPDTTPDAQSHQSNNDQLSSYRFNKSETDTPLSNGLKQSNGFANKLDKLMKRTHCSAELGDNDEDENCQPVSKSKKHKKSSNLTPLDQQYKDLKLKNMDKILAVRVGYKYKFFAQDAVIVTQILHNMLIPGKLTIDDSNPQDKLYKQFAYCSIPDNRLNIHLQKLIHYNLKIGVVEQVETSAMKKNNGGGSSVFEREVTNVFTRATYGINENFGSSEKHVIGESNTIWGLHFESESKYKKYWLISVKVNSGEVTYDEFKEEAALNEQLETRLKYLEPIEVVSKNELPHDVCKIFRRENPDIKFYQSDPENDSYLEKVLVDKLGLSERLRQVTQILYRYLKTYSIENVLKITGNFKAFSSKTHMTLSASTLESLEIFNNHTDKGIKGSLIWVLDHTRTAFGFRQLKDWIAKPLINLKDIEDRLDAIECITTEVSMIFVESLNNMLKDTPDLLRILNRITYGKTSRKEVYFFLKHINLFVKLFADHYKYLEEHIYSKIGRVATKSMLLTELFKELDTYLKECQIPRLLSMINVAAVMDKNQEAACVEFFNLNNYDNPERIISRQRDIDEVRTELDEELQKIRRILKRPMLNYKDDIDFLIEVRNTQVKNVPASWVKINSTKMVSRFRTPETTKLVEKLQYHKELLIKVAEEEYLDFLKRIGENYMDLKKAIQNLATYDCILSLAATSSNVNYVRPTFKAEKQHLKIKNGRNPIIESLDVNYVPNDIEMTQKMNKVMVITGPNMGGKSSYIRQVAIIVIMSQVGAFVPAESAELSLCDAIYTRIGATDNILRGESTFYVEMLEMLQILKSCTENSLLLLDEVGRGTGTTDGIAITYSILKFFLELQEKCPLILFTTHYPVLGTIKSKLLGNYHMSYIEEKRPNENWPSVVFLYKLRKGLAHNSYGLNVARLANVPTSIINRAFEVSKTSRTDLEDEDNLRLLVKFKTIFSSENFSAREALTKLMEL